MQMIHDVNLFPDEGLLHGMANGDELGSKDMLGLQFSTSVHNSKCSSSNFFKDFIMIINTVLTLDLNGLRYVLSINIKDKLVIVSDFTLLASDLLASLRIN